MSKHPLNCIQWVQDSTHLTTLHQAASESVVFMLLPVETVAAKDMDVSMAEVLEEDVEEEVNEVEEDTSKEVGDGEVVHMKMD